jgi:hypothetical protein
MNTAFDASDFAQLAAYWEKAPNITRARLMQAVTASDNLLQAQLKVDLPKGAGGSAGLQGSIATDEVPLDDAVIGMVFTPLGYAKYIEEGTKPREKGHWPPIQPLTDWAHVVLGLDDQEARSAAFAIQRSIAKKGTKANPVWRKTWQAKQAKIREYFTNALSDITRDLAGAGT